MRPAAWRSTSSISSTAARNRTSSTTRSCIVEYENGVRASFNLCMFSPMFYEEMVLCGDEGRLKV